ncbi:MAG: hypothetical protein ACK47B_11650 [Armatimonadota bacterium]
MRACSPLLLLPLLAAVPLSAAQPPAAPAPPLGAMARLPVKEVTVFKDGHAFVLHEGAMPTNAQGDVVMDYLPTPVVGTFWPYASDPNARLTAVTASQRRVRVERTALNLRELLEANVGKQVTVQELPVTADAPGPKYQATILGFPQRDSAELEATSPANSPEMLPQKGELILLRTGSGVKALPIARIQDVTFKDAPERKAANEELRNLLTLDLNWTGERRPQAQVGMVYLQKGLRWIPSYKIDLDGRGGAVVRLQGTLINELTDLTGATANLVVGVPTFAFEGVLDPIALENTVARLSEHFESNSRTAGAFSNSIMTQVMETRGRAGGPAPAPEPADLGPEVAGTERAEDLYVFTVRNVTLRRGQRMVLPVAETKITYKDVYTLDLPFAPPPEIRQLNAGSEREAALEALLRRPKAMHVLRLQNPGPHPLTTAPALITRDNRLLAQGLMTHTPKGASTDLPVTAAVDIRIRKNDVETKRTPNAARAQGTDLQKVELTGTIHLHNLRGEPVELEVTRYVLGNVDQVSDDGKAEKINLFEDGSFLPAGRYPDWWGWYRWPSWWHSFNGIGRIQWTVRLAPDAEEELEYRWHYFAP